MANVIKHKRGSGSDPVASDLVVGEVAIRTDVGKLFTKMDNGSVAEIAGGGSDIAINTLSSSSGTGGGSATFNGSAYRFTLSAPPSVSAQQLLVSINGVIQKPVAGPGQPSEGFSVDGTDIILGDAPATGSDFFILTFKSLGVSEPADNSVTSAKIVDGAIVNGDINASAAIDVSKLSGVLPSAGGTLTGDLTISNSFPKLTFTDSDNNPDFQINVQSGFFTIKDVTNDDSRIYIEPSGTINLANNVNALAGVDVTGNITVTGTVDGVDVAALNTTVGTKLANIVEDTSPQLGGDLDTNSNHILLNDTAQLKMGASNDFIIRHNGTDNTLGGNATTKFFNPLFEIFKLDGTKKAVSFNADSGQELYHNNSKKFETTSSGIDVTGAITVNGSALTGGKVLQVVTATTTNSASTSSSSFVDTNVTANITPSATSSKILVMIDAPFHVIRNPGTTNSFKIKVFRDSTEITDAITTEGSYQSGIGSGAVSSNRLIGSVNKIILDSPSSTSQLTYKMQMGGAFNTNTVTFQDSCQSHITLMEVAA